MEDFQSPDAEDLAATLSIISEALAHLLDNQTGVVVDLYDGDEIAEKVIVYYRDDEIGIMSTEKNWAAGSIVMIPTISDN